MPIDMKKHQFLKPLFTALVALDKAEKALESFQMWRRLFEVNLLLGDWKRGLQQSLEDAQAAAVDNILHWVVFWGSYTPVRYAPAPATPCDGSRSTIGSRQLQSSTEPGSLMGLTGVH